MNYENEGIIINGETFVDGTFTELFFINSKITKELCQLIEEFPNNQSKETLLKEINEELLILKEELKEDDTTVEEKTIYKGLESDGYKFQELSNYDHSHSAEEFYNLLVSINNPNIYYMHDDKVHSFTTNIISKNSKSISTITGKNEEFEYFNVSFSPRDTKDYMKFRLLSFIIGMVDESVINKKILEPQKLYLGYTFPLVTNCRLNLLGLISGNSSTKSTLIILKELKDLELSEKEFEKFKNSFLTYLLVNVQKRELLSDLVKAGLITSKSFSLDNVLKQIKEITLNDLNSFFNMLFERTDYVN